MNGEIMGATWDFSLPEDPFGVANAAPLLGSAAAAFDEASRLFNGVKLAFQPADEILPGNAQYAPAPLVAHDDNAANFTALGNASSITDRSLSAPPDPSADVAFAFGLIGAPLAVSLAKMLIAGLGISATWATMPQQQKDAVTDAGLAIAHAFGSSSAGAVSAIGRAVSAGRDETLALIRRYADADTSRTIAQMWSNEELKASAPVATPFDADLSPQALGAEMARRLAPGLSRASELLKQLHALPGADQSTPAASADLLSQIADNRAQRIMPVWQQLRQLLTASRFPAAGGNAPRPPDRRSTEMLVQAIMQGAGSVIMDEVFGGEDVSFEEKLRGAMVSATVGAASAYFPPLRTYAGAGLSNGIFAGAEAWARTPDQPENAFWPSVIGFAIGAGTHHLNPTMSAWLDDFTAGGSRPTASNPPAPLDPPPGAAQSTAEVVSDLATTLLPMDDTAALTFFARNAVISESLSAEDFFSTASEFAMHKSADIINLIAEADALAFAGNAVNSVEKRRTALERLIQLIDGMGAVSARLEDLGKHRLAASARAFTNGLQQQRNAMQAFLDDAISHLNVRAFDPEVDESLIDYIVKLWPISKGQIAQFDDYVEAVVFDQYAQIMRGKTSHLRYMDEHGGQIDADLITDILHNAGANLEALDTAAMRFDSLVEPLRAGGYRNWARTQRDQVQSLVDIRERVVANGHTNFLDYFTRLNTAPGSAQNATLADIALRYAQDKFSYVLDTAPTPEAAERASDEMRAIAGKLLELELRGAYDQVELLSGILRMLADEWRAQ